jgi:hypothetical protein
VFVGLSKLSFRIFSSIVHGRDADSLLQRMTRFMDAVGGECSSITCRVDRRDKSQRLNTVSQTFCTQSHPVLYLMTIPCDSSVIQVLSVQAMCSAEEKTTQAALPDSKQDPDLHRCGA